MSRIVLMDGHSILRKAYYNVPVMTDPTGFHTNAIAGFLNILLRVTEREKPVYLSVIFGAEEDAGRMPAGLREQMPVLREVLSAMDINILERAEMETARLAGAVVGCLRSRLDPNGEIVLVSGERDLLKFVSEQISVCLLETGGGETVLRDYGPMEVEAACGITPAQFPEWQALTEMAGIGRRTAGSLLGMYGSIENIYAHIDEISGQSIRECLTGRRADVAGGRALCAVSEDTALDLPDNAMEAMELGSEGAVSLTPAAGAILRKLSLQDQLEQFGQCEHASKAPTLDIDQDLEIITVSTAEEVQAVFDKAVKAACAAVRLIHIRARDPGALGKKADGQMFLQMDAEEPVFGCLLCGGSEDERTIYYIESSSRIPEAYIREQLERMLLTDQMSVSVFDVKNDYRDMVSAEKDRELSSDALTRQLFDCKIAAYLMNPLKSDYEIADVADEYLGIRLQKWSDLFGKADLNVIYRDRREACLSCLAKETYVLHKAKPLLEAALGQSSMDRLFRELEMPLTYVLFDMEREGILVKPEELKAYGEVLGGRIEELEKAIHAAAGENFNINSPKQLGEILFEKMELPGGKKTKTGYSTAADVLEKLAPEHPIVKDILEYRGLAKLKSTYADGLAAYIDAGNKIHTSFNQTITATGRLSSTEPNLQNIPMRMELGRRIRKVFIPQEGCIFMDADYSQIELRVLAHMSDDRQLIEAYKMDEDIHRITASKVFHTPFEEVTDLQRRNAKAVNFGIVYGISSFGLSQDLSITPREAKTYIDEYFKTYPGIKKFLDQTVADAKDKGYCETMFGRRRPVPELRSKNFNQRSFGERVAMNSPIQGTAADIIKYAMVHVYDALKAKGLRSKLILQIHDELLIETREDEVEEVREVLSHEMQNACELAVKLEIDLHTGADWYEAK